MFRPGMAKGPSTSSGTSGGGGGSVTSTFTAGNIPLATSSTNLGNSSVSETGGVVTVAAALTVSSTLTFTALAGSGTRMVVASATGVLSTQTIPAGTTLANPTGTIGLTAVNGVLTSGLRSDGAPALSQAIVPTWSATHTFTLKPIMSSLTASLPVFSDGSKGLVSNAMTGTGNVVMSASPTLTGTVIAATVTLSGVLTLNATGSGTSSALFMSAAAPTMTWVSTGGGTNEKVWDLTFGAATMDFRSRTDAHGAGVTWMRAIRAAGFTVVKSLRLDIQDISTGSILILNGSNNVVASNSASGSIGTLTAAVAINSYGLMTYAATLATATALSSSSGLVAVDASLGDLFTLTLSENTTISNPTNAATGRTIRFRVRQAAAGPYTLSWGTAFEAMGSASITAMTGTANKFGYYAFAWNEIDSKWQYLGSTIYADS